MNPNKKRTYRKEFKIEAVKLMTEQGYSVRQAAESLGICQGVLRSWKKKMESAAGHDDAVFPGKGHTAPADEELRKLREENRRLRMERDILEKAKSRGRPSLPRSRHEISIHQPTSARLAYCDHVSGATNFAQLFLRLVSQATFAASKTTFGIDG